MKIREILRIKKDSVLYTCSPESLLTEALATMAAKDIGSLLVKEQGRLAGMLTFREVLQAINANGGSIQGLAVKDVMTRDPVSAAPDMDLEDLRRVMLASHVRYMPVVDDGTPVGVISFHDVAQARLEEETFEGRMLKGYIKSTKD